LPLIQNLLRWLFPPAAEPIASARRGVRVLLRGHVVPRDLVDSPVSGRRCVYYRYLVERLQPASIAQIAGSDAGLWMVRDQDEVITEFYLDDESGRAVVSPERAEVDVERVAVPSEEEGEKIRISEAVIEPGDVIEVEGVLEDIEDVLDEDRGYRELPTQLIVRAPEGATLRVRKKRTD
jgi:hypothetical protein